MKSEKNDDLYKTYMITNLLIILSFIVYTALRIVALNAAWGVLYEVAEIKKTSVAIMTQSSLITYASSIVAVIIFLGLNYFAKKKESRILMYLLDAINVVIIIVSSIYAFAI